MVLVLWRRGASKVNGGSGKLVARPQKTKDDGIMELSSPTQVDSIRATSVPGRGVCMRQMKWDDFSNVLCRWKQGTCTSCVAKTQGTPGTMNGPAAGNC